MFINNNSIAAPHCIEKNSLEPVLSLSKPTSNEVNLSIPVRTEAGYGRRPVNIIQIKSTYTPPPPDTHGHIGKKTTTNVPL